MRFGVQINGPRLVESQASLAVILVTGLVDASQLIASGHVEQRAAKISLALPETVDDNVNVFELKKRIHLQL